MNDAIDVEETGQAVATVGVTALAPTLIQMGQQADQLVAAMKKIKSAVLTLANHDDFTDQGGKPYLTVHGAEKIARAFGVSWRLNEPQIEMHEDGHYTVIYKGEFSMHGATIEALGTRSSADPFFSKRKDNDWNPITLSAIDVDRGDVRKAAMTNCIGNGITRLLGIRNLTWEELQASGINRDGTARVDYKGKGAATEGNGGDLNAKRVQMSEWLLEMCGGDKDAAASMLEETTTWKNKEGKTILGKRSTRDLSDKQVNIVHRQVKKIYDEHTASLEGQREPGGEG